MDEEDLDELRRERVAAEAPRTPRQVEPGASENNAALQGPAPGSAGYSKPLSEYHKCPTCVMPEGPIGPTTGIIYESDPKRYKRQLQRDIDRKGLLTTENSESSDTQDALGVKQQPPPPPGLMQAEPDGEIRSRVLEKKYKQFAAQKYIFSNVCFAFLCCCMQGVSSRRFKLLRPRDRNGFP